MLESEYFSQPRIENIWVKILFSKLVVLVLWQLFWYRIFSPWKNNKRSWLILFLALSFCWAHFFMWAFRNAWKQRIHFSAVKWSESNFPTCICNESPCCLCMYQQASAPYSAPSYITDACSSPGVYHRSDTPSHWWPANLAKLHVQKEDCVSVLITNLTHSPICKYVTDQYRRKHTRHQ